MKRRSGGPGKAAKRGERTLARRENGRRASAEPRGRGRRRLKAAPIYTGLLPRRAFRAEISEKFTGSEVNYFKDAIQEALGESFIVRAYTGIRGASALLSKGNVRFAIVFGGATASRQVSLTEDDAIRACERWAKQEKQPVVIFVTCQPLCTKNHAWLRLPNATVIDSRSLKAHIDMLPDILAAAERGCALTPPRVVKIRRQKDDSKTVSLRLETEVEHGPFVDEARACLGATLFEPVGIGNLEDIEDRCSQIVEDAARRRESIVEVGKRLQNPHIDALHGLISEVSHGNGDAPVHIHVLCEPDLAVVPIDLALPPTGTTHDHLCRRAPVLWRIRAPHAASANAPQSY